MESVRIGRVLRAIRQRRGWRQVDLAEHVGVSQSLIARVERGGAGRLRLDTLARIAEALDARLIVRVDWQGEAADRLLDREHAALVEELVTFLQQCGWEVLPEATFSLRGERGSVGVLAWHAQTATLHVVEVKTVVPDVQGMLATFDRKVRHADAIARTRGWRPARIWQMLAIADGTTSRRRVEQHGSTFRARFPQRARDARRALAQPASVPAGAPVRALWFLPPRTGAGIRHRVANPRKAA